MIYLSRRLIIGATFTLTVLLLLYRSPTTDGPLFPYRRVRHASRSTWRARPQQHPVSAFEPLPTGPLQPIPPIQHAFPPETADAKRVREERQRAVRDAFAHAWHGYRTRAWLQDEVAPLSGGARTTFGGWAATLVDSLDTLYVMGFTHEFHEAVEAVRGINFNAPAQETLNVFETTIRYLGGLLAAYDLSGRSVLLDKALELGEMLYAAFDTENRMPVARWNWTHAATGGAQRAQPFVIVAETGSLSLEFTRLAQLSGDAKFYDAIARITRVFESQQNATKVPGLWPLIFNAEQADARGGDSFSLGAMADSLYEYLPKQHLLLGGRAPQYRRMYEAAVDAAKRKLFFRPMHPANADLLMSGSLHVGPDGEERLEAEGQHLVCFAGGMLALAARAFGTEHRHLSTARKLTEGCVWAYDALPTGVMPETFTAIRLVADGGWDEPGWKREARARAPEGFQGSEDEWIAQARLPQGFVRIASGAYHLRPEAIESVFYMYPRDGRARVDGDGLALVSGRREADPDRCGARRARGRDAGSAAADGFYGELLDGGDAEVFLLAVQRTGGGQLGRVRAEHGGASAQAAESAKRMVLKSGVWLKAF